jgi:hypothetical protein
MTAFIQSEQALEYQTVKDCSGWGPAKEEIRKLPFGEISWPVSGKESIAEAIGQIPSGSFGRASVIYSFLPDRPFRADLRLIRQ